MIIDTPEKVVIKLDVFHPPESQLPKKVLLRQKVKEFLSALRQKSGKSDAVPVVPFLKTKSMFEQADFHVSREFNANYRTTVGANTTNFASWLPITSPSDLSKLRKKLMNVKFRTQQITLKHWMIVGHIENNDRVQAWEPISLDDGFALDMEKYAYSMGILGESLFFNSVREKPAALATLFMNKLLNANDSANLAEFILFRLYNPCIMYSYPLSMMFFQNLLLKFTPRNNLLYKSKVMESVLKKIYRLPQNLQYLQSLLEKPFQAICQEVKKKAKSALSSTFLSVNYLINSALSIYKAIINRKTVKTMPKITSFVVYCMKQSSLFDDEEVINMLITKYAYAFLLNRVTKSYFRFSSTPKISLAQLDPLSPVEATVRSNIYACGLILKLFISRNSLDEYSNHFVKLGWTGNNNEAPRIILDFVKNIQEDLRKYEKQFVIDVCREGKRVVWTDVSKESVLQQFSSLDLSATTVGEVEEFMKILQKNTVSSTLQSALMKFRQNGRNFDVTKKNVLRPLAILRSVNSGSENEFKAKHATVINLFRKMYYLINDHDAGADDELIYVFRQIERYTPFIDDVESYASILRNQLETMDSNYNYACAEVDYSLRLQARMAKKNDISNVHFISKKERRETLSLKVNYNGFASPSDSSSPKVSRVTSFQQKRAPVVGEKVPSYVGNLVSLNELKAGHDTNNVIAKLFSKKKKTNMKKQRRISTFERPPGWMAPKARKKVDQLRIEKEQKIQDQCTFQPNNTKVRWEQHKRLGIKSHLFPKREYEKTPSSPSLYVSKYNQHEDTRYQKRSSEKASSSALNSKGKTKLPSRDKFLEVSEPINKDCAPSIFDLSMEDEYSFSDCKTDPDDNIAISTRDTKQVTHANLRKNSAQDVVKFPVPLLSRQDLLNVFNIIKANDIHNSGNLTEIVRQVYVSDTLRAIFGIKQDVPFLSNENIEYGIFLLDLKLLCGTKLPQISLDLKKNLQYQIKTVIGGYNGVQSEVNVEENQLLRQVLKHLASSVKKPAPSLSGIISSLLVMTNNVCKSLSFDELVLKFERMEAIPPKSSDNSETFSGSTRKDDTGTMTAEEIEAMIKYLRKGAVFTSLSLSGQKSGNQKIASSRIHLRLSKNEDNILKTAMDNNSIGEKLNFPISAIQKIGQGLSKDMNSVPIETLSNISPWLCFYIERSDCPSDKIKSEVLQASSVACLNYWVKGFRHLIGRLRSHNIDKIIDSNGKMLWSRVRSRMHRASQIHKSSITKTFIKALGVEKDVSRALREKHIMEFIRSTNGAIPGYCEKDTHSRLIRDGTLFTKYSKKGLFSSSWKSRYITLNLYLPMDFPSHLDMFESLQPYAELNYYRGKEMQGSVRIDKNSVVMRIADQRNLEFSVRRNISMMSKRSQTNKSLRYDIALKTQKGGVESVAKWCKSIRLAIKICRLYDKF